MGFFEGRGSRVFLDPAPACSSPVAALLKTYPITTYTSIAHIRKAAHSAVAFENTHPFLRELWGRYWLFAHNSSLGNFNQPLSGRFLPVGDTDSERAFCTILHALAARGPDLFSSLSALYLTLAAVTSSIAAHGKFNFLLASERCLFAYSATSLRYLIRQAPFSSAHLTDTDLPVDFSRVTTLYDRVAVVPTRPLTDNKHWIPLPQGTLALFTDGSLHLP